MNTLEDKAVVLLVDDSLTNLMAFSDYLSETAPQYTIITANNGLEALNIVEQQPPDIILLDVIMPEIDGFETCHRLKNNPKTQHIPVIFMTSLADTVDKINGLNMGAVDYVTKPFQEEELLARLHTHLIIGGLQKKLQIQNHWLQKEIDERREAEAALASRNQALRRSEIRFQDMVMSLSDWAWEMDKHFRFTYSSGRIIELLGYQVEEVLERTPFQFMEKSQADVYNNQLSNLLLMQESIVDVECTLQHRDGHQVFLQSNGVPILDEEQHLVGYRGASKDITAQKQLEAISQEYRNILEQELSVQSQQLQDNESQLKSQMAECRQAEAALEQNQERLRLVEQKANDGLWDWDLNSNEIYFSERWKITLGYAPEELKQHPDELRRRIHPNDYRIFMEKLKAFLEKREANFHPLFRCQHKEGHYLWILLYATCIWDEQNKPQRLVAIQLNLSALERLRPLLDKLETV